MTVLGILAIVCGIVGVIGSILPGLPYWYGLKLICSAVMMYYIVVYAF